MSLFPIFAPLASVGTVEQTAATHTETNTLTPSFASQAIGSASPTRRVVAAANPYYSVNIPTISSYSIAGETGTLVDKPLYSEGSLALPIMYEAVVATGTTGTMAPVFEGAATNYNTGIIVWKVDDVGGAKSDSDIDYKSDGSSADLSLTVDTPAGGVVIAYFVSISDPGNLTWVGVDEDVAEVACGSDGGNFHAGGSRVQASADASLTVSVSHDGTDRHRMLIVGVWSP